MRLVLEGAFQVKFLCLCVYVLLKQISGSPSNSIAIRLKCPLMFLVRYKLEIVFTIAAPAFDILFIGYVFNTKIAYTTAEKLTFEAFY